MLVGRVLTQDPYVRPGRPLDFPADIPDRVAGEVRRLFANAGGRGGTRPDAAAWARALRERGEITVTRPKVRSRPSIPMSSAEQPRGRRGRIHVSRGPDPTDRTPGG